ncbi:hypothetical protein OXX59_004631 [Metschnikowia pulcherrima]
MSSEKQPMLNPHDAVQSALLSRIVNNMKSLNESVYDMNLTLSEINENNKDIDALAQLWNNYSKGTELSIKTTGQTREPL